MRMAAQVKPQVEPKTQKWDFSAAFDSLFLRGD